MRGLIDSAGVVARALSLSTLLSICVAGIADAQPAKMVCARDDDVRVIEVLSPGVVGRACDLRYVYASGAVKTPYHANNDADYCDAKAIGLVENLSQGGFSCTAETASAANTVSTAHSAPPLAQPASSEATQPRVVQPSAPLETAISERPVARAVTAPSAAAVQAAAFSAQPSVSNQPALSEPVSLVEGATPIRDAAPATSAVGRLVGADPAAGGRAERARSTIAALDDQPAAGGRAAGRDKALRLANASGPSVGQGPSARVKPLRAAQDIIVGVLAAQSAAWNEGDLDAFMEAYWNSPQLRFVSGTTVTRGWNKTLRRYRDRYGGVGDLGQLSFEDIDVEMITETVAIVVGRYRLLRLGVESTGAFTLVVKKFDGHWRIVHDHTASDAPGE